MIYSDKVDTGTVVRDNTILIIPNGYHAVASAPGYNTYYVRFLAVNHRVRAVVKEAIAGWVSETVSMLYEMGH